VFARLYKMADEAAPRPLAHKLAQGIAIYHIIIAGRRPAGRTS